MDYSKNDSRLYSSLECVTGRPIYKSDCIHKYYKLFINNHTYFINYLFRFQNSFLLALC